MAFIQCKDKKEQEEYAEEHSPIFMTEDFRCHTKLTFSDDACYVEISKDTMLALLDLHHTLEFAGDSALETSFTDIVTVAQDLKDTWEKAMAQIKRDPVVRRGKRLEEVKQA